MRSWQCVQQATTGSWYAEHPLFYCKGWDCYQQQQCPSSWSSRWQQQMAKKQIRNLWAKAHLAITQPSSLWHHMGRGGTYLETKPVASYLQRHSSWDHLSGLSRMKAPKCKQSLQGQWMLMQSLRDTHYWRLIMAPVLLPQETGAAFESWLLVPVRSWWWLWYLISPFS